MAMARWDIARSYDMVGEYQVELLNRLGGLHERFFKSEPG